MSESPQVPAPPPLVALAAWIIPGGGYWMIRQRDRGTVVGVTILLLFVLGILIGGVRVVEAPPAISQILQRPWFIGQFLVGPIGLIAAWISNGLGTSAAYADVVSHSRINEIGTLYTAVAGMLNLMAIIDAAWRAGQEKGK